MKLSSAGSNMILCATRCGKYIALFIPNTAFVLDSYTHLLLHAHAVMTAVFTALYP